MAAFRKGLAFGLVAGAAAVIARAAQNRRVTPIGAGSNAPSWPAIDGLDTEAPDDAYPAYEPEQEANVDGDWAQLRGVDVADEHLDADPPINGWEARAADGDTWQPGDEEGGWDKVETSDPDVDADARAWDQDAALPMLAAEADAWRRQANLDEEDRRLRMLEAAADDALAGDLDAELDDDDMWGTTAPVAHDEQSAAVARFEAQRQATLRLLAERDHDLEPGGLGVPTNDAMWPDATSNTADAWGDDDEDPWADEDEEHLASESDARKSDVPEEAPTTAPLARPFVVLAEEEDEDEEQDDGGASAGISVVADVGATEDTAESDDSEESEESEEFEEFEEFEDGADDEEAEEADDGAEEADDEFDAVAEAEADDWPEAGAWPELAETDDFTDVDGTPVGGGLMIGDMSDDVIIDDPGADDWLDLPLELADYGTPVVAPPSGTSAAASSAAALDGAAAGRRDARGRRQPLRAERAAEAIPEAPWEDETPSGPTILAPPDTNGTPLDTASARPRLCSSAGSNWSISRMRSARR